MRNTFISLLVLVGCFSCGESESIDPTINQNQSEDSTITVMDTSEISQPIDENKPTYEYFEDYIAITTRTELEEVFGDYLTHDTVWYNEGTERRSISKLDHPETGHKLTYFWQEDNPEQVGDIEVYYHQYDENWEPTGHLELASETGIYLGMPMKELREWNGKPFDFSGFGWDFGGGVLSDDGKLGTIDFSVFLLMGEEVTAEEYDALVGDMIFSSEDEAAQTAPIYINSFHYYANVDQ
jgi:hypothetical protein